LPKFQNYRKRKCDNLLLRQRPISVYNQEGDLLKKAKSFC